MQALRANIRWMVRADLDAVIRIDHLSYPDPWDHEAFRAIQTQKNCVCFVAELEGDVVAYATILFRRNFIEIVRLAVDPSVSRCGIGTALVLKLKSKIDSYRRSWLSIRVDERLVVGQRFLAQQGFETRGLIPELYGENVDGVLFQWEP